MRSPSVPASLDRRRLEASAHHEHQLAAQLASGHALERILGALEREHVEELAQTVVMKIRYVPWRARSTAQGCRQ